MANCFNDDILSNILIAFATEYIVKFVFNLSINTSLSEFFILNKQNTLHPEKIRLLAIDILQIFKFAYINGF